MSNVEFDRFVLSYRELHKANIALTGEEPEYFAEYKMRDFAAIVQRTAGRFLDFGSGVGASVAPFRRLLPRAHLVCADVSAQSLVESQRQHGSTATEFMVIENGRLPLTDASIDGAFACCVFHHIPHVAHLDALNELRRVPGRRAAHDLRAQPAQSRYSEGGQDLSAG